MEAAGSPLYQTALCHKAINTTNVHVYFFHTSLSLILLLVAIKT